jgi:beta-glucosidase-like glycosyl hydrolase
MAFSAGADLLLICNSPEKAVSSRSRIMEALCDGEIPLERLEESLVRIRHLRNKYVVSMEPCNQSSVMDYFGSKLSTRMAVNSNQAGMPDFEPLR